MLYARGYLQVPGWENILATKFMQSLDPEVYSELRKIAKDRGISMQELIRAVIVPDWMMRAGSSHPQTSAMRRKPVRRLRARSKVTA